MDTALVERAKKIKLLVLDVDGVLTDGRIIYGNYGDELKFFDVQDGFGLSLWQRAGFKTVIITAKKSKIVIKRSKEMKIAKVYQNAFNKLEAYKKILKNFKVKNKEVCYIGDDLIDLPILTMVGLAVSVPSAAEEVLSKVHYVTRRGGGRGAVREVIDFILKSQGKWEQVTNKYFKSRM